MDGVSIYEAQRMFDLQKTVYRLSLQVSLLYGGYRHEDKMCPFFSVKALYFS